MTNSSATAATDAEATTSGLNANRLLTPYLVTLTVLMLANQVIIALAGNRITVWTTLPLVGVAGYYLWFTVVRRHRLRMVRFAPLVAHAGTFAIVNTAYHLHFFVLAVLLSPAIRGDAAFPLDDRWFGVTFGMATFWGVGLVIHTIAAAAQRGYER